MKKYYSKFSTTKVSALLLLSFLFCQFSMAQKPMPERSFEITLEEDEKIESEYRNNMRINKATGYPIALYAVNFDVPQGTPEQMAMVYLNSESKSLGIPKNKIVNLQHHATRTTNAGSVVRYRQFHNGYPVNKAEVTISISPQNKVVYVMNSYVHNLNLPNVQPNISKERAFQKAFDYLNVQGQTMYEATRTMIYSNSKMTRLAHEVIISTGNPQGEWHVFVDTQTEEIFKVVDLNYYYTHPKKEPKKDYDDTYTNVEILVPVDGTGMVFNPDPLSSNMVAYGATGFTDSNDAASTQLNNARFSVTLRDIDLTGGVYTLRGPRAEIVDFDAPNTGLFTQNSATFNFNRQDQAFEAVNCYYHIDFLMDYINNTLGCNVLPYQYIGGVKFDPHGANGGDNSFYTSGSGQLSFGEGGVDDAEDSDVIHHELGHGLHDWVTSGGLSQVNGLSEGSGDYVAQSYNRSLGNWASTDAAYNFVFNWDGHNEFWNGRITNYTATYPGGLVNQIHTDGQIWASCLMGIWDQIGQQRMDKIFYEGLGMTGSTSSQNDAANAVYQAALNLAYTSAEISTIHGSLTACGYTLPPLAGPPIVSFTADNDTICLDDTNMVTFTDTSAPAGTSWVWTFEGGTTPDNTVQNPVVTYAAEGTYNVTLVAMNSNGTGNLTETDFITVVAGANCANCINPASGSLALAIPDGLAANTAGPALTHTITVPPGDNNTIDTMTLSVDITHTFINDLVIELIHPNGTNSVTVWDRNCGTENALNVTFEDGAPAIVCADPTVGTYNPVNPLSAFNGLESEGVWTISIVDWWVADLGTLNDWSFEICGQSLSVGENSFDEFAIFPNPNNGSFTIKLNSSSNQSINVDVYDIRGRSIYNKSYNSTSTFENTVNLNNAQSGIYLVKVNDGDREVVKKIIVE